MNTYNRYTRYRHTVERHNKLKTFAGVFGNVHMGSAWFSNEVIHFMMFFMMLWSSIWCVSVIHIKEQELSWYCLLIWCTGCFFNTTSTRMFSIVNKLPSGLLEFRTMSKKFPWHLVILLGSGFALAEACKVRICQPRSQDPLLLEPRNERQRESLLSLSL